MAIFDSIECWIFSYFHSWTWPLFRLGRQRTLTPEDLYRCSKSDETSMWSERLKRFVMRKFWKPKRMIRIDWTFFTRKWESEVKNKKKPSLFWAVLLTFGPKLIMIFTTFGIYQVNFISDNYMHMPYLVLIYWWRTFWILIFKYFRELSFHWHKRFFSVQYWIFWAVKWKMRNLVTFPWLDFVYVPYHSP